MGGSHATARRGNPLNFGLDEVFMADSAKNSHRQPSSRLPVFYRAIRKNESRLPIYRK
jgi:hypothetical protein